MLLYGSWLYFRGRQLYYEADKVFEHPIVQFEAVFGKAAIGSQL